MIPSATFVRAVVRRLLPALGPLLLLVLIAGGAHHHADGPRHSCAICAVGHLPAITANVTAAIIAPRGPRQAFHAPPQRAPRPARLQNAPSRAPPQA